jgi:hypothetical protein
MRAVAIDRNHCAQRGDFSWQTNAAIRIKAGPIEAAATSNRRTIAIKVDSRAGREVKTVLANQAASNPGVNAPISNVRKAVNAISQAANSRKVSKAMTIATIAVASASTVPTHRSRRMPVFDGPSAR